MRSFWENLLHPSVSFEMLSSAVKRIDVAIKQADRVYKVRDFNVFILSIAFKMPHDHIPMQNPGRGNISECYVLRLDMPLLLPPRTFC